MGKRKLIMAILRTRAPLFLGAVGSCLAVAVGYSLLAPDHFKAVATLFLERTAAATGESSVSALDRRSSDVDLLRSERVAQRVVENEGLLQEPALRAVYLQSIDAGRQPLEALAQYLAGRVEAGAAGEGGVVRLAVTMDAPALAARIANAYARAWGEVSLELRADSIRSGIERAGEELTALRARLGEARARNSNESALADAGSRADEQFVQLSRLATRPLAHATFPGSISAASDSTAHVVPAIVPQEPGAEPTGRLAVLPAVSGSATVASSAEDEIRLAQQSLERAEDRMARLSAEGIGAPFPIHVLRAASVPPTSNKPPLMNCAGLGLAFGLLLGILAVTIAEVLDKRVRRPSDVSRSLGLIVLGSLPVVETGGGALRSRHGQSLELHTGHAA